MGRSDEFSSVRGRVFRYNVNLKYATMFKLTLLVFLGLVLRDTYGEWVWKNQLSDQQTYQICPPETAKEDGMKCCVFPFKYKGTWYNKCTTVDAKRKWCATMTDMSGKYVTNNYAYCPA